MGNSDISKYDRGWAECQPDMKARRFEYMFRRLLVVWATSLLVIVAMQAARTIKRGLIHEAGQLPTVATTTPNR